MTTARVRYSRDLAPAGNCGTGDSVTAVCVVIPARNEEARIGRCLDAVRAATDHLHRSSARPIGVRVVVVLDRCTDGSADIVARHHTVETVISSAGNVGAARAFGAHLLLPPTIDQRERTWLANTDADSVVPHDWLTHMVDRARRGADVVLGTVEPDDTAGHRLRRTWHARHTAGDGHPHVHGANLGVRASTYFELGEWPALSTGEDEALVRAAEARPAVRIARTGAIPVTTSARFAGRAPHGFAHYLLALNDELARAAVSLRAGWPADPTTREAASNAVIASESTGRE